MSDHKLGKKSDNFQTSISRKVHDRFLWNKYHCNQKEM